MTRKEQTMSREYIISVPDDAGFVEYSYIRGGRKYNTHYAYKSMERLVRCKECKHGQDDLFHMFCAYHHHKTYADDFCSYGSREERSE